MLDRADAPAPANNDFFVSQFLDFESLSQRRNRRLMKIRINGCRNDDHLRVKAFGIVRQKGIARNDSMRMPNVVLRLVRIFQELEFFILRRSIQQPDAVIKIKDDLAAFEKLFFEPGRADQQGFPLNKNKVNVFCPSKVSPADKKRPENNTGFFGIISRVIKDAVIFFRNEFRKLPVESLLLKKGKVLLEAVTLAG